MYRIALGMLAAALLAGCAGKDGWKGAAAEKQYDKELEARRLAAINNNDDYYEIHKDGKILVFADAKDYRIWLETGEIPLVVTKIGVGPQGETVKLALNKTDSKSMEKKVGYAGAAQKMYEGSLEGLDKDFFGLVGNGSTTYVFSSWNDLQAYKASRSATGYSENVPGAGRVIYSNARQRPEELSARVARLYAP